MSDKLDRVILAAVKLEEVWKAVGGYEKKSSKIKRTRGGHSQEIYRKEKFLGALEELLLSVKTLNLMPGEPIFCMRGKDLAAPAAVLRWIYKAEEIGTLDTTLNEAREKHNSFTRWQNENFQLVKVPT